jgi:hypothetical protein
MVTEKIFQPITIKKNCAKACQKKSLFTQPAKHLRIPSILDINTSKVEK